MRIKEKAPLASCLKMTDEMNGETVRELLTNEESKSNCNNFGSGDFQLNSSTSSYYKRVSGKKCRPQKESERDDVPCPGSPNTDDFISAGGGRLKFFKDGKFILELSHRKDGEKTCWIPVPKKTYWPLVGTPRQENSSTLSVSDDSSSVQSSPWQRDHCWKQSNPKSNLNKDLEFCFVRDRCKTKHKLNANKMRRRPFDLETPSLMIEQIKGRAVVKNMKKDGLASIITNLWERILNSSKLEPGIVSPRKRILRELERVTLEEASKRQRAKATVRNVNSHSISAILAKEDESVLRNLLRSPSPDSMRPGISNSSFPSQQIPIVYAPSTTPFYPTANQPFRSQVHQTPSLWPIHTHYPSSSPSTLPLYPLQTYTPNWTHNQRPLQDNTTDVPLNLSKNAG